MQNCTPVNLLWTGGWDSTFQLLRLLLIDRVPVQPYYLIDVNRRSTLYELKAMQKIKEKLFAQYPYTTKLLQPIRYYAVYDIEPDETIEKTFKEIHSRYALGSQYEWLAKFCRQHSLNDMQLGIEKSEDPLVDGFFTGNYNKYHTMNWTQNDTVFKYFSFPLIDLSKVEMEHIANNNGWQDIMKLIWFCHNPTQDKQPCGKCRPCIIAMREGHSGKIPFKSKVNYYVHQFVISPIKSLKKTLKGKKTLAK